MNIVEALNDALRTFLGWLCKIIYPMIINVWDLFVALSDARLFNSSGAGFISEIYKRIGLLLGLIMLFRVLFSLIQMLLNPDMFSDKEKGIGNIVKKAIVVILLLGFTPTIFEGAFYIQSKVLDEHILGKIVFGNANVENLDDFGISLSTSLFGSFFVLNPLDEEKAAKQCTNYESILEELAYYERLDTIDSCLTSKFDFPHYFSSSNGITEETSRVYAIEFNLNGILAVFVGGMVLWLMLMYCIYLGARIVQLAFLQIIAPLSIVSYLSPKKDTGLEKWLKLCLSTFLDVFIRISIIYFISLVIYLLFKSKNGEGFLLLEQTSGASGTLLLFVRIAVILGLLMVGKKLPDLIGEIFPSLGVGKSALGFGISWKKMTESMLGGGFLYGATAGTAKFAGKIATAGVAGAAFGAGLGFAGGRGLGRFSGALGGFARGMKIGSSKGGFLKNMGQVAQKQGQRNAQKIQWANSGSTTFGRFAQKASNILGYEGTAEKLENDITKHKDNIGSRKTKQQSYKKVSEYKKAMEDRAESKLKTGSFAFGSNEWKLQQNVLKAEAEISALENAGASAHDIAEAKARYNTVLDVNKKLYIEGAFTGRINDGRVTALKEDLLNTIKSNKENFDRSLGTISEASTFSEIEAFEKETTKEANKLQRQNEMDEVAIENIENSEEYKKAKADRDAVGGQRGGN